MKAVLCEYYGGPEVLKLGNVEKPRPKHNEVLIRIYSTSVTAAHCAMRQGKPLFGRLIIGITKPKFSIPGTDLSGEIVEVGSDVTKFKVGDEVLAATDTGGGCYAEFICLAESDIIVAKPKNNDFNEAAAIIDGATTALSFLRDSAKIKKGQKILINGASGGIGTSAVQLAKYYGADVTAVCSKSNVQMVKELGADNVIDYTKDDFTKIDEKFDIVFDTVGKSTFLKCINLLNENGVYLSPVLSFSILFQMLFTSVFGKKKAIFSATGLRKPEVKIRDLEFLSGLMEEGKLKAVVDKKYKLEDIVEAHRYVELGHKKGNVVLSME